MPKGNGKMYNDKYNSPDNYTDMDGMTKTFTHIDYSGKKSFSIKKDIKEIQLRNTELKKNIINNIVNVNVIKTLNPLALFLKNFFFDFNNFFSILDAGIYNKYAINVPAKNGDIIPTNFPIAFPIAVKLSRNL